MGGVVVIVRHERNETPVELEDTSTVAELQERVYTVTNVRPAHQKLLAPGLGVALARVAREHTAAQTTLRDLGLQSPTRLSVVGAKGDKVERFQEVERLQLAAKKPRTYHPSMLRGGRPRSTATPSTFTLFMECAVHPSTPSTDPVHARVRAYLERLMHDPAVLHVGREHHYRVGMLTELLPHEHPDLLGLNENRGERILLRIRTDAGDGLRDYATTRRVLMHELAHNEISGHPPAFHTLNSELNRQLLAFEAARAAGTHTLSSAPRYEPGTPEADTEEAREERRQRILYATEARLSRLDGDIQAGCGASPPPS